MLAERFDTHRIRSTDLYADPEHWGFEYCGACGYDEDGDPINTPGGSCPSCNGLRLVRTVRECVGCGHCCLAMPCYPALVKVEGLTNGDRCPYLYWGGTRYWCGLSGSPEEYVQEDLGHGEGCCQPLNSWRKEVRPRG